MQRPVPDELLKEAVRLLAEHGSQGEAARHARRLDGSVGVHRTVFGKRIALALARGICTPSEAGFEVGRVTTNKVGEATSIAWHPAPAEPDPLPGFVFRKTTRQLGPDGRVEREWARYTREDESRAAFLEAVREAVTPAPAIPRPDADEDDRLVVLPIADAHFGERAWGQETGEDYDLRHATSALLEGAIYLIDTAPPAGRALVCLLGDFLHCDNTRNETSRGGHPLDVDGRLPKVLRAARDAAVHVIDYAARRFPRVDVVVLEGNHDEALAYAIALALDSHFRDTEHVAVHLTPQILWGMEWGVNLLGFTHGHTIPKGKLAIALANSFRPAFGRTWSHHVFAGHIHHQGGGEQDGVLVHYQPALSARGTYAAAIGATAHRGLRSYIFDRHRGPVGGGEWYLPKPHYEVAA